MTDKKKHPVRADTIAVDSNSRSVTVILLKLDADTSLGYLTTFHITDRWEARDLVKKLHEQVEKVWGAYTLL